MLTKFKSQAEWAKSFFEWNEKTKMYVCKLHIIKTDTAGNVVKKRKATQGMQASTIEDNFDLKYLLHFRCGNHTAELIQVVVFCN